MFQTTGAGTSAVTLPEIPMGSSVPRIIHQNMFRGWDALEPENLASIAALKARNPGWEYRFYDAAAARAFIRRAWGPAMLALYDSIDPVYYAARSDFLRYLVCYVEGGVYLDIKSTALRPLDGVIRPDDVFVLSQWPELAGVPPEAAGTLPAAHPELAHVPGYEYTNWFIVAAPGHPFLLEVVRAIVSGISRYRPFLDGVGRLGVLRLTGPIAYTRAIHPMRTQMPHRLVRFHEDMGFVFSIYGNHRAHRQTLGTHYSRQVRPVVQQGPVISAATRAWFGTVQPKLHGFRRRMGLV